MRSFFGKYIRVHETIMVALSECQIALTPEVIQKASCFDKELLYEIGTEYYEMKKYSQAQIWYRKASTKSSSAAQNMIGEMYFNGNGVAKSERLAMEWYLMAHNTDGNKRAQYNIGFLYHYGHGVKIDSALAREWYIKSANQGYHMARSRLHLIDGNREFNSSIKKDMTRYQKPAEYNDSGSKNDLKRLHNEGNHLDNEHKANQNGSLKNMQLVDTKYHKNDLIQKSITRKKVPVRIPTTKNDCGLIEEKNAKLEGYIQSIEYKLNNIAEEQDKLKAQIKKDDKKIEILELALANCALNYDEYDENN